MRKLFLLALLVLVVALASSSCSSKKESAAPPSPTAPLARAPETSAPVAQAPQPPRDQENHVSYMADPQRNSPGGAQPQYAPQAFKRSASGAGGMMAADGSRERLRALGYGEADKNLAGAVGRRADERAAGLPRLGAGEELWVIARADWNQGATPPEPESLPRCGLNAKPPGSEQEIPLPLTHTDVKASVAGYIASVSVTQQYENPYQEKIEAVYVFPLPQDAAVSEFVMTVGERKIRGLIREREQAEQLYADARQQGYVASLLTQERPNIFTQSVANLEPGKRIDIALTYFNPLALHDGEYEFVFPMVVGPRFNPPGTANGVGAVPRGQHGSSGQATEVQYLPPSERSGHDIALTVDIDAGLPIERIESPTHVIDTTAPAPTRRQVTLHAADTVPNKDFVLRYRLSGEDVRGAFLTHRDQRGGFFTLMLQPPAELAQAERAPMELIFVLDCSGSMSGAPLDIAKRTAERALRRLGPNDTFQIIQFSESAAQLGPQPLAATPANLERGLTYLRGLQSEGGTMMIEGVKAALDFPHDPQRLRVVSFMTDGFIGNDPEILGEVQQRVRDARVFSFGIGSSVNRYLLDRMAVLGRGAVAYVGLDEGSQRAVDQFYERVSHPALTDLSIDWGALQVTDVYPQRLPDLFVGRPVVITGRFRGDAPTTVRVTGRAGGTVRTVAVAADPSDGGATHPALANVWARLKIADLEDRATVEPNDGTAIKQVALEYGLMSGYTAFLAVDSSRRTAGDHGTTVAVPVPVPDGVRYDTTVGPSAKREIE
ncbi:MAG: VIT domain-containing protein [Deltaproteobacteria bacterium]|nr:VIT domain-containing protein [Deltaproteobacteria bacterium]